eukprot:1144598-Pelagomonas_calceolata.AAC.7
MLPFEIEHLTPSLTRQSHRRMKADAEWDSLTAKVEGREEFYKDVKVVAFVATIDDVPEQPQAQQAS